jgi:hypothetical protein
MFQRFLKLNLLLGLAFVVTACEPFHYGASDPRKLRDFLVEQNILRESDQETILALIRWSRLNLKHNVNTESVRNDPPTILELLEKGRKDGVVTVEGCWGTADFFQQMLGAAGIQAIYDTVELGGRTHASAEFPSLDKRVIHADDLHDWPASSRSGEIPSEELLVPSTYLDGFETPNAATRAYETGLIDRFLPDSSIFYRIRNYGRFYSADERAKDASGETPIDDVAVDPETLQKLDAEIDRLGGPEAARKTLLELIEFPGKRGRLTPLT